MTLLTAEVHQDAEDAEILRQRLEGSGHECRGDNSALAKARARAVEWLTKQRAKPVLCSRGQHASHLDPTKTRSKAEGNPSLQLSRSGPGADWKSTSVTPKKGNAAEGVADGLKQAVESKTSETPAKPSAEVEEKSGTSQPEASQSKQDRGELGSPINMVQATHIPEEPSAGTGSVNCATLNSRGLAESIHAPTVTNNASGIGGKHSEYTPDLRYSIGQLSESYSTSHARSLNRTHRGVDRQNFCIHLEVAALSCHHAYAASAVYRSLLSACQSIGSTPCVYG